MNKKKMYFITIIMLVVMFVVPYMGVIYYTMPRNDEFASAFGVTIRGGYSLAGICRCVAHDYINWEGNYSGIFIYTLFNPLIIGDIDYTVRIINIVCFLGFTIGWTYIIYRVFSWFEIKKDDKLLLSVIVLILSMNCRFLRELLGWYTGFMYYTLQLLLGTLGMFMVWSIIDHRPDKKWKTIAIMSVACLFEVIGAGGTLHVSAILCYFILLFLIWIIYSKKEWIKAAILFAAIFISTLVNALAPGHRVRKDDYESISLVKGIIYTLVCVYKELRRLCAETYIPYVLFAIFIMLIIVINRHKKNVALNPVVVAIAGICCIIGSSFPVCYGYARASMASRGYETMDIMIILWSVIFLASLVNELKSIDFKLNANTIFVLAVIGVFYFTSYTIANVEMSDIPSVQCAVGLADGSIKDYSEYWFDVLHQVEDAQGDDVVIKVKGEYMDRECIIDRCLFTEEPTDWVNNAAAVYYGYDSIRLERVD